ncbi:MAG TPA: hypothetical protein VI248_14820 [Kineosporiaceae bacterium]
MPEGTLRAGLPWDHLPHAYGLATDTPGHLQALMGDDPQAQHAAVEHLFSAVLHQGTVYPATPAAVRVIGSLLDAPALRRHTPHGRPVLASVVRWLSEAAESAGWYEPDLDLPQPTSQELDAWCALLDADDEQAWDSPVLDALSNAALADLRDSAPELVHLLLPLLDHAELAVRMEAAGALAQWGMLPAATPLTARTVQRLQARLEQAQGRDERAGLLLALGQLGADTAPWLGDPDPAVQAMAALRCPGDDRSTPLLVSALTHVRETDTWFGERPPLIPSQVRFTLLQELLARDVPFADLLPAALAVAEVAHPYTADDDWGPLLRAAFPATTSLLGVPTPPPARLDASQRAFLQALLANRSLWDTKILDAKNAFTNVGLPYGRSAVAKLAR